MINGAQLVVDILTSVESSSYLGGNEPRYLIICDTYLISIKRDFPNTYASLFPKLTIVAIQDAPGITFEIGYQEGSTWEC